jgi:hypothetical protein
LTAKRMEDWFLADDLDALGISGVPGITWGLRRAKTHEDVERIVREYIFTIDDSSFCLAFPEHAARAEEDTARIMDVVRRFGLVEP